MNRFLQKYPSTVEIIPSIGGAVNPFAKKQGETNCFLARMVTFLCVLTKKRNLPLTRENNNATICIVCNYTYCILEIIITRNSNK